MSNCSQPNTGLIPINDLGTGYYTVQGNSYQGGFYPNGLNARPSQHEVAGRKIAKQILPMGPNNRIVFASVGYSFTRLTWEQFETLADGTAHINPKLKLANLAQASQDLSQLADRHDDYWTLHLPANLATAGVHAGEVQVVWLETGEPTIVGNFATRLAANTNYLISAIQNIKHYLPRVKMVYVTSSHYSGYKSTGTLEPQSCYDQAFPVKAVIELQINHDQRLDYWTPRPDAFPWLSWAGYPWCDGSSARGDGLTWACPADVISDGIHQSSTGATKLANVLLADLLADWTAKPWFLDNPDAYDGGGSHVQTTASI